MTLRADLTDKANGTWQVAEPPTIEELIGRAPSGAAIHEVAQEAERLYDRVK